MAKPKRFGNCALCLKYKELQRSHLLGRAIHRLSGREQVLMTPQYIDLTQKQLWRHLLCHDCEQRFNKHGETPVLRLVQRKESFALLDKLNVAMPFKVEANLSTFSGSAIGIDTEQLAYFALSVLWRSGVQEWRTLKGQTTGVKLRTFEEPIRKYLAGEAGSPFDLVVNVIVGSDIGSRFNSFGPSERKGPFSLYTMLVRGLWFHIFTGVPPGALVRETCCIGTSRKVIFLKDCEREVLQAGGHMMATAEVSPKLSQPEVEH